MPPTDFNPQHEYAIAMKEQLEQTHEELRQLQLGVWQEDHKEPPPFDAGDLVHVCLENRKK